jgi:hypothetical protein
MDARPHLHEAYFSIFHERFMLALRRSKRVLDQSRPDTFLGRKTQEPFPVEEQ